VIALSEIFSGAEAQQAFFTGVPAKERLGRATTAASAQNCATVFFVIGVVCLVLLRAARSEDPGKSP
jgi:hypothetical protein